MKGTRKQKLRFRRKEGFDPYALLAVALVAGLALSWVVPGCADLKGEAHALEEAGDVSGALALYQDMLESDQDDIEALEGAASDLVLLGRYEEALALQERVVALDSRDVQTRIELGFNYLNHADRPNDAAHVLGEAADLEPSARNLTFLAQAQIASGDAAGAEQSLRRAIEVDPSYGYSYSILTGLLSDQGRTKDSETVVAQAAQHGINNVDSH